MVGIREPAQRHPVLFVLLSRLLPGHQLSPWRGESLIGNTCQPEGDIEDTLAGLKWCQQLDCSQYVLVVKGQERCTSQREGFKLGFVVSLPVFLEYKLQDRF